MNELLDNVTWHTLSGAHARHASGSEHAKRYARGFSPIVGFADPRQPRFDDLVAHCDPGEPLYSDGWDRDPPDGWRIEAESTMFKMVWAGEAPPTDPMPDAVPLRAEHGPQAFALATAMRPGPFGPRTIELGDYVGWFVDGELVAMAGERMRAGPLRELSGVCTHPSYQGRGLARRLMETLIARQLARGETPFLHVLRDNRVARALYARMGFRDYRETVVRIVART